MAVLKIKQNGEWIPVGIGAQGPRGPAGNGAGDMVASVYDPTGKATDIFAYTDTAAREAIYDAYNRITEHNDGGEAHQDIRADVQNVHSIASGAVTEVNTVSLVAKAALSRANEAVDSVGDIKTTARTDLGEKWLLCNGGVVSAEHYPELASVLTESFLQKHFGYVGVWSGDSTDSAYCVVHENGYWVVGGSYYDGKNYYGRIAYTTSLDEEWTIKDLWNASKGASVKSIAYADGYWVAVGRRFAGTGSVYGAVAYTTNLDGEWNTTDQSGFNGGSSGDTKSGANSVVYANGYWVIAGTKEATRSTGIVLYATSPDGEWTKKEVLKAVNSNNGDSELKSLYYTNGYWVATGSHHPNSTTSALYAYIAYATSPDGTWTEKSMSTKNETINCITYADGYWVAGDSKGNLYYAESLDGEWTVKSLCADSILGIAYANDNWYVVTENTNAGIYTSQILWNKFVSRPLVIDGVGSGVAYAITVDNDKLIMAGKCTALGTTDAAMFVENGDAVLPTISVDGAYTYIKAKE